VDTVLGVFAVRGFSKYPKFYNKSMCVQNGYLVPTLTSL